MKTLLARLILVALLAAPAWATVVTGTIEDARGNPVNGRMEIRWPSFVAASGELVAQGYVRVTLSAGAFSVDLFANVGATPAGTSYTVDIVGRGSSQGIRATETWVVPASGPVDVSAVRTSTPPVPTAIINLSQISPAGASLNDCIVFDGTVWAASACPGAGGGEANTISSQGAGVSFVSGKVGVDLQLNSAVSANPLLTIALDDPNDEVDFTVNEGSFTLSNLGGAVTDAQVPDSITIDLATLATTATTANAGDSATAFFSAGAIEAARGGTGIDTSASTGVLRVNAGTWTADGGFTHLAGTASDAQIPDNITIDLATLATTATTANAGDSATSFFSSGEIEDARIPNTITLDNITQITTRPHSSLTGLTADDHTIYPLLLGRSGGQVLIGGTGAGDDLTLQTTSNVSKGSYILSELDCTGNVNGGALTADASGVVTCSDDDGGAGSGDNLTVNGTAIDTTGNLDDDATADIEWTPVDGGAGGPDDIRASVKDGSMTFADEIGDGRVTRTSNPVLTINTPLTINVGNTAYALTSDATIDVTGGTTTSCTARIYVDTAGNLEASLSTALCVTDATCTNITCAESTTFPDDTAVMLATWGLTVDETWDATGTDHRGWNSDPVLAGTALSSSDASGVRTINVSADAIGPTQLVNALDLGGETSLEVPNGAAPTTDAFGEIAADNDAWAASRGALEFFDGTASVFVPGVDSTDTPTDGQVMKIAMPSGVVTWEDDTSGGSPSLDTVANPAAAKTFTHDVAETLAFVNTGAFGAINAFQFRQDTGNPTAGTLLDLRAADAQVTVLRAGDGTNGITLSQAGALTAEGTGAITATDLVAGSAVVSSSEADATFVLDTESPAAADIAGTFAAGLTHVADSVGTTPLDDGADTPLSGEYVRVDTVDQAGFEYRTTAEVLADIGGESETHATEHQNGGADEVATATPAANAIPKAEADGDLANGWIGLDQSYVWTGPHDFGGTIIEIQNGTAAPLVGDCDADAERGRIYQKTDATSGQQLYLCEGAANGWVVQGDGGGAGGSWSALTAPTGAVSMVSDATAETATFDYQAAFTTGCQFCVQSSTGDPSGGTLFEVNSHDINVAPMVVTTTDTGTDAQFSVVNTSTGSAGIQFTRGAKQWFLGIDSGDNFVLAESTDSETTVRFGIVDIGGRPIVQAGFPNCQSFFTDASGFHECIADAAIFPMQGLGLDFTGTRDDDDCTGNQSEMWYDTTDSQFEICNADSGTPVALTGGGGGMTSFDVQGDDGAPNSVITDGNTLVFTGGTNISTEDGDAGADTLTIDLDLTGITDGQFLYDNSDALGAISQISYDGTDLTINATDGDSIESNLQIAPVYNNSGATLFECAAVYISGFNVGADLPEVEVADNDGSGTMPALGLVQGDITNGSVGYVVTGGEFKNLDTSVTETWVTGAPVYVNASGTNTSSDCADTLTETKPTGATALIQAIGRVGRVNATAGSIQVQGAGRSNDVPNAITIGTDDTINTDSVSLDNTWASGQLVATVVHDTESPAVGDIEGDFASGLTHVVDSVAVAELADGADTALVGENVHVAAGDATIFEYLTDAEHLTAVGADDASNLSTGTIPAARVGTAHIDAADEISQSLAFSWTGVHTFTGSGAIEAGGASSLEIPNNTNPTTGVVGRIAVDTDAIAASRGLIEYYDGTETMFAVGFDAADTLTDQHIPKFQSGTSKFTLEPDDDVPEAADFGAAAALDGTTGALVTNAVVTASITAANVTVEKVETDLRTFHECHNLVDFSTAIPATADIPSLWGEFPFAFTITKLWCEVEENTATINIQRDDGTPANMITADLVCDTTEQDVCAAGCDVTATPFVAAEDNVAIGEQIDLVITAIGANVNRLNVCLTGTID